SAAHASVMPASDHHREGIDTFKAGDSAKALGCFRAALAESEWADLWSDWGVAQFALGHAEEAEAGFQLAIDIDPGHTDALINLATLLLTQGRQAEAASFLPRALETASAEQQGLLQQLGSKAPCTNTAQDLAVWAGYLRSFLGDDENERSYFETHLRRYLETLVLLPDGSGSRHVLELGAAFHHLTPALVRQKHYASVRCNDIWSGAAQEIRRVTSSAGDSFEFGVDNFDVQSAPWPY